MRRLQDILACPACKGHLKWENHSARCGNCAIAYPVVEGVPVFVSDASRSHVDTRPRENYDEYVARTILKTLDRSCVVLDVGSGNMKLDHPNIVRMEPTHGPNVDVVADAMNLPFKDGAIDFLHSTAVLEHLSDPFQFGKEAFRVCGLGGYTYAETNFVWPYHGYPEHFFNFSVSGVEKIFAEFRKIRSGVPAHGMPSFSLAVIVDSYVSLFKPQTKTDRELVRALKKLQEFFLRDFTFDKRFDYESAKILAGVVFFYGMKQDQEETIVPQPLLEAYSKSPSLRHKHPNPYDLMTPENVWTELRQTVDLSEYYAGKQAFSKRGEDGGPVSDPILI
jgi:uncharacterized protein YbaR (Trm112 family)/ubiquinone/menaquinone biosynthesis C-methylase UbiE